MPRSLPAVFPCLSAVPVRSSRRHAVGAIVGGACRPKKRAALGTAKSLAGRGRRQHRSNSVGEALVLHELCPRLQRLQTSRWVGSCGGGKSCKRASVARRRGGGLSRRADGLFVGGAETLWVGDFDLCWENQRRTKWYVGLNAGRDAGRVAVFETMEESGRCKLCIATLGGVLRTLAGAENLLRFGPPRPAFAQGCLRSFPALLWSSMTHRACLRCLEGGHECPPLLWIVRPSFR